MDTKTYNIAELAAAGGVSSRAVRFYVQQGLLAAPTGVGRGNHYTDEHLRRLVQIGELQRAGHSLAAIKEIPVGATPPRAPGGGGLEGAHASAPAPLSAPTLVSGLVSRVTLLPGVTVEFDVTKYQPSVEGLMAMRELAWEVFGKR